MLQTNLYLGFRTVGALLGSIVVAFAITTSAMALPANPGHKTAGVTATSDTQLAGDRKSVV